jgi:hypothetical protein
MLSTKLLVSVIAAAFGLPSVSVVAPPPTPWSPERGL